MKRYFTMSLTLFTFSALNVSTYFLLSLILGNTSISEVFSLTYPFQFVSAIIQSFFSTASNIRKNKEKNENCVQTGLVFGIIFSLVVFVIISVFLDKYILFMNKDPLVYGTFTLMTVLQMFLSLVIHMITEKLYFEDKDKKANLILLGFIILNLITITLTALITINPLTILLVNIISLFIYVLVWLVLELKKFKFDFKVFKNIKYESNYIVYCIFIFFTYLFGYSKAFSFGPEYAVALNFVNLLTDPFWDSLFAIDKIAKIDISKGEYIHKKSLFNSFILTVSYLAVCLILFFSLFTLYKVILSIGLIYLSIQFTCMIINAYKANAQSFLQLEYSATKTTIVSILSKFIRFILVFFITSPYINDIAQLFEVTILLIVFAFFRLKRFKLDSFGHLIKKEKSN